MGLNTLTRVVPLAQNYVVSNTNLLLIAIASVNCQCVLPIKSL